MRPGLIAVGVAFALVGAGVILGILYPGNNPTLQRSGSADVAGLSGGNWRSFLLPATASNPATLTLSWSASSPANVSWYEARTCSTPPGTCIIAPALRLWIANVSGHWSATGDAGALYELWVYAAGGHNVSLNFTATFTEQYHAGKLTLPPIPFAITMVGGSLLAGIGAVALYLGLFLPTGVYGPFDAPPPDEGPDGSDDGPGPGRSGPSG